MDELCRRLAADLDAAFPDLVDALASDVYSGLRRLAGADEAQDLTQETFIRAYRALSQYEAERIRSLRLRGWVWTIALNLGRNHARDRARRPTPVELEDRFGVEDPEPADEAAWDRRLRSLPPIQRRGRGAAPRRGPGLRRDRRSDGAPGGDGAERRPSWLGASTRRLGRRIMTIEQQLGRLRRPAPPAVQPTVELGTGLVPGFSVYEAPVGEVAVVFTPRGVRSVRLVEELDPQAIEAKPPRAWGDRIRRALRRDGPGTSHWTSRGSLLSGGRCSTRPPPSPRARCVPMGGWRATSASRGRPGGGFCHGHQPRPAHHPLPPGRPVRRPHRGVLPGRAREQVEAAALRRSRARRLEELAAAKRAVRRLGHDRHLLRALVSATLAG